MWTACWRGSAARHLPEQRHRHSHGTTDTRHLVKSTGVMVAQFPTASEWDDGQTAYVAIGIAAKSDEHLGILRQLTHVLGDEQAAAQLRKPPMKRPSSIS